MFIIPKDEQEFVKLYLDNSKFSKVIERYELLHKAITNSLSKAERVKHNLTGDVHALAKERMALREQMFKLAVRSFALDLCAEQRKICEHEYWVSPGGNEAEFIEDAQMPDLCDDVAQYEAMIQWWSDLSVEELVDIATTYEGEFGIVNTPDVELPEDREEVERNINNRWLRISLDDRIRIYHTLTNN